MISVTIEYEDGHYYMTRVSSGEVENLRAKGYHIRHITRPEWRAYCAHLDQGRVWRALLRAWDNAWHQENEGEP